MTHFDTAAHAALLADWVVYSQRHLYFSSEREGLVCYGAGDHGHWGVHTHQKAFSAFAIAALDPDIDWAARGISKETVLSQALGMLRFNLASHLTGDFVCSDGEKWGHTWIYVLGIERMMHAIEALDAYLTEDDRDGLRKMLISEADFLLLDYPVEAGLVEHNKPESNIWNGATLYRAAAMYPDAPNARAYEEKALSFFANGISIESDEFSQERYGAKTLAELFVGANFYDSYSCNHHRYMNVGYMVICLSNIAMLHFSLKAMGKDTHPIVMHHVHALWTLIRSVTYKDGRLLRIGGDSRARYCYCQDYAMPMWALVQDVFGEDCSGLESGWLDILKTETAQNGDGSFLSNRIGPFEQRSPVYYTRLESDRANVVSMSLYWHRQYPLQAEKQTKLLTAWQDDYHGAAFNADGERFASFVWRSCEKPQGMLLPKDDSSLAEWRNNLAGRIEGVGMNSFEEVGEHRELLFEGGFLTWGATNVFTDVFLAEGQLREHMAEKRIAFAALPDQKTVLSVQFARAVNRCYVARLRGVNWNVPNDLFNGRLRRLTTQKETLTLRGGELANKVEQTGLGSWVNVDGKVGLACTQPLTLYRAGKRQVDIVGRPDSGTLYAEEIASPCEDMRRWADRGEILIDVGFAVSLGDAEQTRAMEASMFAWDMGPALRAVGVTGADGAVYVAVLNVSREAATAVCPKSVVSLADGTERTELALAAGEGGVYRIA